METETQEQPDAQAVAPYVAPADQAGQLLRDIVRASTDPTLDAEKITALANLAMKMQDRDAEKRFHMAKHAALMEMPTITKNGAIKDRNGNVQSRYSKWEDIDREVRPLLSRHNLSLSFNIGHEGQQVTVQPILSYSDGEFAYVDKGGEMVLAIDTTGSKNATQGAGSAASYGKRHAAKAMLNIIEEGEDTDGKSQQGTVGYDDLPDKRRALVDAARLSAAEGTDAYAAYYKTLSVEDKRFLTFNVADAETGKTWHDQNKAAAAVFDEGKQS